VPELCGQASSSTDSSSVWSMVASQDGSGWAQIGYIEKANCGGIPSSWCYRYFWEWTRGCFNCAVNKGIWGDPNPGDTHDFRVYRNWSDGDRLWMEMDYQLGQTNFQGIQSKTGFNPWANGNWGPAHER
jgi:hypothetical protein